MRTCVAISLLVAFSGCGLYFSGDDLPQPCQGGAYGDDGLEAQFFYDPTLGTCIGRGLGCDSTCGPCPETTAQVDLGLCYSECTDRSEGACLASAGCIAAYEANPLKSDDSLIFTGCWQTVPSGPVQGTCDKLSAYECARHDDCALVYDTTHTTQTFSACVAEPFFAGCSGAVGGACPPGSHCEDQCTGNDSNMSECKSVCVDDATCAAVDCAPGYTCAILCEDTMNGGTCGPTCVPDPTHDPGACTGAVNCFANAPACPSGTTAGIRDGCWTGYCIPNAACGPSNPGQCYAAVTCNVSAPSCPTGTTPGITNGCYTGYCIPTSECGPTACGTLTTEAACEARSDCDAVFTGMNCTCTMSGCTCQTVTFDHCETL